VNAREAAQRWADVWERGWRQHDPAAIKALYADDADWSQHPFRPPDPEYVDRVFAEEQSAECTFEAPLVDGDRAAVAWTGKTTLVDGTKEDLVGVSLLRFDEHGLVVWQRDIWVDGASR
jgi:SnoaL-like domain